MPQRHRRREVPPRSLARLLSLTAAVWTLAPGGAPAQNVTGREFKFGVLAHDVHFLGGKESGIDLNPELIVESPVSDAWAAKAPWYVEWLVQPRPTLGGEVNTAGDTNQFYFGATWSWQIKRNLVRPGDGIVASIFFGPSFNDGYDVSPYPGRKSLGSTALFREAFEFGYRINPVIEISAFIDHESNAGLARYNQSQNDAGIRFGVGF